MQRIGDFAFRAYSYYNQLRDDEDDIEGSCSLDAADIDMAVDSQSAGRITGSSSYTLFTGKFQKTKNDVTTDYYCVHNREQFVQTYADDPTDLTDGSAGENVSVELMTNSQYRGYDLVWPEGGFSEGDASEIGPDVIAYDDSTGEYVIVEAKTSGSTDTLGITRFRTDAYEGEPQLSRGWISESVQALQDNGNIDDATATEILSAIETNSIRQEVVFVRDVDSATGETLTNPRYESTDISNESVIGVDKFTIIDLQTDNSDSSDD